MDFVVCINNTGYEASLEKRKLYSIQEGMNVPQGFVSIVDESGEAYIFEDDRFLPIDVSAEAKAQLVS